MNKQSISFRREEKYYSKGKWLVLFDHIFLLFIYFRILLISRAFYTSMDAVRATHKTIQLRFFYIIPTDIFLIIVLIIWITLKNRISFSDWKTTRKKSFMTSILPIGIAFLFSLFFLDTLEGVTAEFPEQFQDSVIPTYYLSYVYALLYSAIRVIFAFDYYQSFYLKRNRDYLLIGAYFYVISILILSLFFPKEWIYMFF